MNKAVIFALLLTLVGCEAASETERREENRQLLLDAWNSCLESGGIPIRDDWFGEPVMDMCEFKPPQEKE